MPVTVCSDQGFTMTRDKDGFCRASGVWNHCMLINAVRFDRPGALICQSWGPDTPSGPTSLEQPSFSFWCDKKTVEHSLLPGDLGVGGSMGASEFNDLPASWCHY